MGENAAALKKNILNDPELKKTSAVKNSYLYAISDSNIIELAGPRIVEGLEKIDELISKSCNKIKEEKINEKD